MLNFSEFVPEEYLLEMAALSSALSSDDKGKMHELLLAKHLNPKKNKLPEHWRSQSDNPDHSGTPEQVHDKLRNKIGEAAYKEIDSHARQTAQTLVDHLYKGGHIPKDHAISKVHWTSNRDTAKKAGDHEKTTKIKDVNSNADLILTAHHKSGKGDPKFIGVSAKYGGQAEPNYKNDGLDALEQKSKLAKGTLTRIQRVHDDDMEASLGYSGSRKQRHSDYKIGRELIKSEKDAQKEKFEMKYGPKAKGFEYKPKHKEAKRALAAEESSLASRTKMARSFEKGLSNFSDEDLRGFVRHQVAAPTVHHHVVAFSHVQDDGSAVSHVKNSDEIADTHLNNYTNLKIRKGNGISSDIVGTYNNPTHKDHGKQVVIARQNFKASSGPHQGTAGSFKLEGTKRPSAPAAAAPINKTQSISKKVIVKPTVKSKAGVKSSGEHGGMLF
jgi:hypothetical protein